MAAKTVGNHKNEQWFELVPIPHTHMMEFAEATLAVANTKEIAEKRTSIQKKIKALQDELKQLKE